ncbi:MAG: hypothetical protein ABSG80_12210 [Verrucomicrobiota bacterium]|jgi:hypothetical protein
MDAIISSATRRAFEDSYVQFGVLRDISNDFDDAEVEQSELPPPRQLTGQRRLLIGQYYASVDWASPTDASQVLRAYASHLRRLKERSIEDEVQRLLKHLRRDRMRSQNASVFDVILTDFDSTLAGRTKTVEDTVSVLETTFSQAMEHLNQALEHLQTPQNSRARKDGLRDCLSAMESVLKVITKTNDIKDATAALRADHLWGHDAIVKDGLSIWNRVHELYPDVRHGQASGSELTDHECLYWVDRITTFVRFIARRADEILPK